VHGYRVRLLGMGVGMTEQEMREGFEADLDAAMLDRNAFEQWCISQGWAARLIREGEGYHNIPTDFMWEAWKEAIRWMESKQQ